jgi:hypothetical protein
MWVVVPVKPIGNEMHLNIDNIVPDQLNIWAGHQSNRHFTFRRIDTSIRDFNKYLF